jgi:hypothetical protein
MFIATTQEEAFEHLTAHWREIEKGTVYPGLETDDDEEITSGISIIGSRDVVLMKVRYRVDGRKFGAAVALDEDAFSELNTIARVIANRVNDAVSTPEGTVVEFSTTIMTPGKWFSAHVGVPRIRSLFQ